MRKIVAHHPAGANYEACVEDIDGVTPFDADVIETLARLEGRGHRPQTMKGKTIDSIANGDDDEGTDSDSENADAEHPRM